jgi:hypothetical protein
MPLSPKGVFFVIFFIDPDQLFLHCPDCILSAPPIIPLGDRGHPVGKQRQQNDH